MLILVLTFTQEQLPGLVTAAQDLAAKFQQDSFCQLSGFLRRLKMYPSSRPHASPKAA